MVTVRLFTNCERNAVLSLFLIITEVMVTVMSVPPITMGEPVTLLSMITAIAPEVCAFFTFSVKLQFPLLINATLPVIEFKGVPPAPHASWVAPAGWSS